MPGYAAGVDNIESSIEQLCHEAAFRRFVKSNTAGKAGDTPPHRATSVSFLNRLLEMIAAALVKAIL